MIQRVALVLVAGTLLVADLQAGIFSRGGGCPNGQCSMGAVAQTPVSAATARTERAATEQVASSETRLAGRSRLLRRAR